MEIQDIPSSIAGSLVSTDASVTNGAQYYSHERPGFSVEQVQLQFELHDSLKHLLVQNNVMFLISRKQVLRIDLDNPTEVRQFAVPANGSDVGEITLAWLLPNGIHLIAQLKGNHYFYLHSTYTKFKVVSRLKGIDVRRIGFPPDVNDESTGNFLAGTGDGSVYVGYIKYHDQDNKRDDKYAKQVYKGAGSAVEGILFTEGLEIDVAVGGAILSWNYFDLSYAELVRCFKTTPSSSKLPSGGVFARSSDSFVYLNPSTNELYTPQGLAHLQTPAKLSASPQHIIVTEHHVLVLDAKLDTLYAVDKISRVTVASIPLKSSLHASEKVLGLVADHKSGTYWVYTSNNIYEVVITNESVLVWYNYYKLGDYEQALRVLDADSNFNPYKRNTVLVKQGYELLQKGGFGTNILDEDLLVLQEKGVRLLAESFEPFEKVCLMLLNLQNAGVGASGYIPETLLIEYLKAKFTITKTVDKNRVRMVVLSSWIVELTLRVIFKLRDLKGDAERKLKEKLDAGLDAFLHTNYKVVDQATVYQVMRSLHYPEKLIAFAELVGDYRYILEYYIEQKKWSEAIKTLIKIYKAGPSEIIYLSAPVLLLQCPKLTTDTWLQFEGIDYVRLLPAIITFNKTASARLEDNHTLRFLSKLVIDRNIESDVLANYYLALLISHEDGATNKSILRVIEHKAGVRNAYDRDMALRLCLKFGKVHPAVMILIEKSLFEQALRLALQHHLTEVAEYVLKKYDEYTLDDDDDDYEFVYDTHQSSGPASVIKLESTTFSPRKKLWMMFARYLIEGVCRGEDYEVLHIVDDLEFVQAEPPKANGVKSITSLVVESITGSDTAVVDQVDLAKLRRVLKYLLNLSYTNDKTSNVLSLKDLLPLFPEQVHITKFKDEIVASLNQYNTKINQLSQEMHELSVISHQLKEQMNEAATKASEGRIYTIVEPGEPCQLCRKLLVSKNFIVFPSCHHNFHKECLVRYYLQLKGDYQFKKAFQNFKRNQSSADKSVLDKIMLKECVLCNDSNINAIDAGLINQEKEKEEMAAWAL